MADNAEDVQDVQSKLEQAAAGTESESSTDKAEVQAEPEVKEDGKDKTPGPVDYNRFKEVNEARKAAEADKADITAKLEQAQNTTAELAEVVKHGQKDSDLVAALRGLAENPKYADLIGKVDQALAGVELDEEKGDKSPEEAAVERHQILENTQELLQNQLEDQKQELLLQRADQIAKDYLGELPEEYKSEDKNVISEMWANRLDWDDVVDNPNKMPEQLRDSLQVALKDYGEPRGKVAQTAQELDNATETPSTGQEPSIEEQMGKYLGKNYGALKTVETPSGKKVQLPEVSDSDFETDFAAAFKALNQQKEA